MGASVLLGPVAGLSLGPDRVLGLWLVGLEVDLHRRASVLPRGIGATAVRASLLAAFPAVDRVRSGTAKALGLLGAAGPFGVTVLRAVAAKCWALLPLA